MFGCKSSHTFEGGLRGKQLSHLAIQSTSTLIQRRRLLRTDSAQKTLCSAQSLVIALNDSRAIVISVDGHNSVSTPSVAVA